MLLEFYLASVSDEKITHAGSVTTSSISLAKKYFEDEGTSTEQLLIFWNNAVKHGCAEVVEWA